MFQTPAKLTKLHRESYRVPGSVQQIIPVQRIFEDGIFLCGQCFSKTWRIQDINYFVASAEDKQEMFLDYSALLNLLDAGANMKVSIINRSLNERYIEDNILLPLAGDNNDKYRTELNDMLLDKIMQHNNAVSEPATYGLPCEVRRSEPCPSIRRSGLVQEKYLTISIPKQGLDEARAYFARKGVELEQHLSMMGSSATALDAAERLRIFHDFFRPGEENAFSFDIKERKRIGHSFRDYVCPDSFESVDSNTVKLGGKYARAQFLRDYATFIKDSMITEICDLSKPLMLSIDILPIPMEEALVGVERRMDGVETNVASWQRNQNKNNNWSAELPRQMENQRKESREMYEDLTNRDQRLFYGFVSIVHTADSKEELTEDAESIAATARKNLCQISPMTYRQLDGLNMALPYGIVTVSENSFRTLNTESLAVLMPFKAQEILDSNGMYYGINAISRNLILCDRSKLLNPHAFFLGVSGSGKSMAAKMALILALLSTGDDVIVVDPEREYGDLIRALGGEVVIISPTSKNHINALDMTADYDDENPIVLKAEFMLSLCEQLIGKGKLGAKEKSIIDRCVASIYRDYVRDGFSGETPTLKEFHAELVRQPEAEAKEIALALELFTTGSLNIFAHQTNVNMESRLLSFDILDLGKQLKTVGMLIMLDAIINRVSKNRALGKTTHIFIDEVYLFFASEYSAAFLSEAFKRLRKKFGIINAITQNVTDCLQSHTARTMLANSEFLLMLNQAPIDRIELAKLLNISDTQLSYITNAQAGRGLLKVGSNLVPFVNDFPRHTELYQLMTTRPGGD